MRIGAVLLTALALVVATGHARASGFATYFANLSATGAVSISSGVQTTVRAGVGVYHVTFVRRIINCVFTVSVTGPTPGYASVNRTSGRAVTVFTFLKNGTAHNLPSNIILVCGP
jgi:hypothetical protein